MFKFQIRIHPLGMLYGSSGGFLSPDNLVGRSGAKFPPEAATLAGLFFRTRYHQPKEKKELKENLRVAGPFWAETKDKSEIYVPIPWSTIVGKDKTDRWELDDRKVWQRKNPELDPDFSWQPISTWNIEPDAIQSNESAEKSPWEFIPILHPKMQTHQRSVVAEDGLFLENAVQMEPDKCLVYLSTHELQPHELEPGWYRFGGENHLVEIECLPLDDNFQKWLNQPIERTFALIAPAVWGSQRYSYRYPQNWDFGEPLMLTDKPVPYRYRAGGRLGRGRYAVPAGSVYVLDRPIGKPWYDWPSEWFPTEGFNLKDVGCGLCLPVDIPGVSDENNEKGVA
ncbi:CRISPR-associated protein [Oscillatoriales cyanobacterium LEGE 11467]|uniref:CRISPR-associated protein n=2 Tax=Zarconia TaxID=2992130 RepID=A0A928Z8V5_9CYAN|nr:CRISPR-associated protein [Zarconia navalis LEGE 11467]